MSSTTRRNTSSSRNTRSRQGGGRNKKLRFGALEIYDIPMELGIHPPNAGGAPVTLGWEPQSMRQTTIDLYELTRYRSGDFKLSVEDRTGILERAGYTKHQIAQGAELARILVKQRESTLRKAGGNSSGFSLLNRAVRRIVAPRRHGAAA